MTDSFEDDMTDMEILNDLIEDYGLEPTDTIADLIEAIRNNGGEDA